MQASNAGRLLAAQTGAAKALYAIVITTLLLFWLNQDSISLYCQQKYHQSCELPVLGQSPAWRLGGNLTHALGDARDSFIDSLEKRSEPVLVARVEASDTVELPAPVQVVAVHLDKPPVAAPAPVSKPAAVKVAAPAVAPAPAAQVAQAPLQAGTVVSLAAGDEVFLVGDSLMQGVAPHLANSLRKRYQIKSVNLSRQSTGLAYPGFFNWPQTVAKTLESEPNIRLMVIFLGPNDPWDMPQGKGKPFLRFKSPEWEVTYRQRIDSILDQARAHNVQVIWVGPPNMQKPKLSTAMAYLSGLYEQQTGLYQQHYVSANPVLGYNDDSFSYTLQNSQGKRIKTRVDDGIHFTTTGQKLISERILSMIAFPGLTVTGH
ncbi:SGNH/GDSL hydrolase family protein [Pseudomonas donghuensis]|uniref:SGNH/GDSL hydrolase family protein n=1 Tax=Pseudomonas donghuensis TaxID=1163398 RepID=UPI000C29DE36|nr:SGNH family hydrolase [Pseudomonas donghuensis]PJY95488.1 GDSL family lipase [Pseudomonas donghuensis]WKY27806.1 SGNH family hydrolase [Pseudomonas donghuensis]